MAILGRGGLQKFFGKYLDIVCRIRHTMNIATHTKDTQMKAVIADAQTQSEAQEIVNNYYSNGLNILWVDINDKNQVTIAYETQSEAEERTEKELQAAIAQIESETMKPAKTRKQPTAKQLNAKAQELFLYMVECCFNSQTGKWEIRNQYGKCELVYECKTATGISRKLTAMYWEKQITRLKNEELITA